jgi:tRNA(fMet)-specific endonuclease VapC
MIRVMLDTNTYTAAKRGDTTAAEVLLAAALIGLSSVVIGELLGGFAAGTRDQVNRQELSEFLALAIVSVLPVDASTAEQYAAVYAALRKAGTPILQNDMWIAATALQHGFRLFTLDRHFLGVPGLRVVTTLKDLVL